jgi:hypothetical protein
MGIRVSARSVTDRTKKLMKTTRDKSILRFNPVRGLGLSK